MEFQKFTSTLRVGVIVSNKVLLNILRSYLETSVHLFTYFSCEDLLNAVENRNIDVILADRTLPHGEPAEILAEKVVALEEGVNIPMVVMTAGDDLRWQLPEAMPVFVLPKPFSKELVIEVLHSFAKLFHERSSRKKTILIVDDSFTSRKLIKKTLAGLGNYEFIEAASGEEALERLGQMDTEIKFVTCDLHMEPGMNGIEFTKHARAKGHYLPIFILTSDVNHQFIESAFRAGVNFYFLKKDFGREQVDFLQQFIGEQHEDFWLGKGAEQGTILVIEDNPTFRQVIASHLSTMGLPVAAVPSTEEALAILKLNKIVLSIVDINLPGKSGIDFIHELQKFQLPPHERLVLIYSAMTTPLTIFKAFQSGATDYLKPPFNLYELNIRIYNLLRLRKAFLDLERSTRNTTD